MSRERPTAAERTVSMFTGMTDLDGESPRDGVGPRRDRGWAKSPRVESEWQAMDGSGLGDWYASGHRRIRWDKTTGRYVYSVRERVVGTFETLTAAIVASEVRSAGEKP